MDLIPVTFAGRGRGACPRAWPAPGRPGWRGPPRSSSALRCWGAGICAAHGSPSPSVSQRGVHGEVGRRHVVEVVPADGERHGHAGPDPRAVGGDHGGPADPGRVDEHLAAAVLLHERGRGDRRDRAARRAPRWRGSRRPPPPSDACVVDRDEHVHALGPARLDRAVQARRRPAPGARGGRPGRPWRSVAPRAGRGRARDGSCGRDGRPARASGGTRPRAGWRTTAACAGRCTARTTPRASTSRPRTSPCGPTSGVYFGTFFCMNASWPRWTRITDSGRSSSTGMMRSRTRVEVVDEVALGRAGPVEQRLVEVGERHARPVTRRSCRCSSREGCHLLRPVSTRRRSPGSAAACRPAWCRSGRR